MKFITTGFPQDHFIRSEKVELKKIILSAVAKERSSWSVRNFWFHCIIYMKNNYHQTFVVCLMTYIHVKFSTKKFGEL